MTQAGSDVSLCVAVPDTATNSNTVRVVRDIGRKLRAHGRQHGLLPGDRLLMGAVAYRTLEVVRTRNAQHVAVLRAKRIGLLLAIARVESEICRVQGTSQEGACPALQALREEGVL